jgi:hypothetical protein
LQQAVASYLGLLVALSRATHGKREVSERESKEKRRKKQEGAIALKPLDSFNFFR